MLVIGDQVGESSCIKSTRACDVVFEMSRQAIMYRLLSSLMLLELDHVQLVRAVGIF